MPSLEAPPLHRRSAGADSDRALARPRAKGRAVGRYARVAGEQVDDESDQYVEPSRHDRGTRGARAARPRCEETECRFRSLTT